MDISQIITRLVQSFYVQAISLIDQFGQENEDDRSSLLLEFYQALKKTGASDDELAKLDRKILDSLKIIPTKPEQDNEIMHYIEVNKNRMSDTAALEMIRTISDPDVCEKAIYSFIGTRLTAPVDDSGNFSLLENAVEQIEDLIRYEDLTVKLFFANEEFGNHRETLISQLMERLEVPAFRILCLLRILCEKNDCSSKAAFCDHENLLKMIGMELDRPSEIIFDWNIIMPFLMQLPVAWIEFLELEERVKAIESPNLRIQTMTEFLKMPYLQQHKEILNQWTADIKTLACENEKDLSIQKAAVRFLFLSDPDNREAAIAIVQNLLRLIREEVSCAQICSYLDLYRIHIEAKEKKAARQILELAEKKCLELDLPEAKSFYLNEVMQIKIRRTKKNAETLKQQLELSEKISSAFYRLPLKLSIRFYLDLTDSFDNEEDMALDLEEKTIVDLNIINEFQERVYLLSALTKQLLPDLPDMGKTLS